MQIEDKIVVFKTKKKLKSNRVGNKKAISNCYQLMAFTGAPERT